MSNNPNSFRERLIESQEFTPACARLRKRARCDLPRGPQPEEPLPGLCSLGDHAGDCGRRGPRMIVYKRDLSFYVSAVTMLIACAVVAVWLVRDLARPRWRRSPPTRSAGLFYGAATILTVASLIHGLGTTDNPRSTFDALFIFVFLFVCSVWSLANRITASEMAMKEQMLRLECRLADLSERLGPNSD